MPVSPRCASHRFDARCQLFGGLQLSDVALRNACAGFASDAGKTLFTPATEFHSSSTHYNNSRRPLQTPLFAESVRQAPAANPTR
jgi:hypothetical protein